MENSRKAQGGTAMLAVALGLAVAVNGAFGYALSRAPTNGQLYYASARDHGRFAAYVAGLSAQKVRCDRS